MKTKNHVAVCILLEITHDTDRPLSEVSQAGIKAVQILETFVVDKYGSCSVKEVKRELLNNWGTDDEDLPCVSVL